ncbi:Lyzozyme M1 (1,4-beta-N-acetylmuramidase) [Levilactobacillus senmaizukei DSM 21775 = NBRC 103853]|uniref:Lyzozyme M1 (1,4-beta-N-acetylmuramidase) n=1 Tax=Levilactobacillus senmaizukei DSM 21775 = NBRC 103853 TaxID=1423803 RepID=A0A0R2DJK4_9LACO|nr:GH25 family lysozyme [Levilactobacillus senmaizukei]KRN03291.1 Lyzozyme M1 (1,4-beta-N-acetylmuramidase) [Levilactobacillus senmaizukei DSM 21775 = NBRC 103853]
MQSKLHKLGAGLAALAAVVAVGVGLNTTTASASGKKVADISQYQGNINWKKASKDLKYAIIRVQHGSKGDAGYMVDSKRNVNAKGAYKYGVPFGQYMFAEFTSVKDAQKEAKDFYKRSNSHTKFYVLDEEKRMPSAKGKEQTYVNAWLKTMRSLTDKPLIMYAGEYYANAHKLNFSKFDGTWIAKYSSVKPKVSGTSVDLWQYTSSGRVSGISGNVDLNKVLDGKTVKSWFASKTSHAKASYYNSLNGVTGVKGDKAVYEYKSTSFAKKNRVKKFKAGQNFKVKAIVKNGKNAYRFQLMNGKYITANQAYVSTY